MKPAAQHSQQALVISAVAVNTAYGDHPAALFGGIATRLSCREKVPGLKISTPEQVTETPYCAASPELPPELPPELRLQLLCQGALEQLPPLPTDLSDTLIVNQLPSCAALRNFDFFTASLSASLPQSHSATLRQQAASTSNTSLLEHSLGEFRHGPWQRLIFGSTDCRIDSNAVLEALQQYNCCSDLNPDRCLLGEGAAYLMIEKVSQPAAGQIVIAGLAEQEEPNNGLAASKPTSALASSITTCLSQRGIALEEITCLITGYVPDMVGTLEWHQTERKLWPNTGRRPCTIEELNPHLGTGDCGSANLALALALACARFEFRVEPVTTVLICDISDQPWRGAVCLQQVSG